MPGSPARVRIALATVTVVLATPLLASARQQVAVERPGATQSITIVQDQDAKETREKFELLLAKLPPAVGRVLKTDPTLLGNDTYLATYPALSAFLKQHPEVRSAPGFYFEHVNAELWYPPRITGPENAALRIWSDILDGVAVFSVFTAIALALMWIVRTIIQSRRWNRVSKVQTDVHNKLLDRFTANEDLLAYIQSPAGRKFLESEPLTLDAQPKPLGAPLNRILLSVQVGVVLAAGALGLLFVSGRVISEVAQPLFAIGVLALAVGAGFVVSAAASFLLSRRLGLLEQPPATGREHTGTTNA
jgi:hypothetical protein